MLSLRQLFCRKWIFKLFYLFLVFFFPSLRFALLSSNFTFCHTAFLSPGSLSILDRSTHARAAVRLRHNMKHWNTFHRRGQVTLTKLVSQWAKPTFFAKVYLYGPFCPVECVSIAMFGGRCTVVGSLDHVFSFSPQLRPSVFAWTPSRLPLPQSVVKQVHLRTKESLRPGGPQLEDKLSIAKNSTVPGTVPLPSQWTSGREI